MVGGSPTIGPALPGFRGHPKRSVLSSGADTSWGRAIITSGAENVKTKINPSVA